MVREINTPNSPLRPASTATGETRAHASGAAADRERAAVGKGAETAHEPVRLSGNAQALQAVEQKLLELPEVNEQRVAEIKAALASGEYQVNDVVIADKLLAFEDLFN